MQSSLTVLERASNAHFRLYSYKSNALISANNICTSVAVLKKSVQLVITDHPCNVRRERQAKHSVYDELSLTNMNKTIQLARDHLRPGCHGIFFCTAKQISKWQSPFKALFPESDRGPSKTFMVDNAPLTFVDHPSFHRNNSARKFCALVNAVYFALHVKKNRRCYAQEKKRSPTSRLGV